MVLSWYGADTEYLQPRVQGLVAEKRCLQGERIWGFRGVPFRGDVDFLRSLQ